MESSVSELDASFSLTSSPVAGPDGRSERFLLVPESPRRMMTRSQDATFSPSSEQVQHLVDLLDLPNGVLSKSVVGGRVGADLGQLH